MTLTEEWSAPLGVTPGLDVLVTSLASDSHTWNLVYLQVALEELGHRVHNLGACVPDRLLVAECRRLRPELVVVSSLNGHGFRDGLRVIGLLRACPQLSATAVVIGGKLGVSGPGETVHAARLRAAGFDEVFGDDTGIGSLAAFIRRLVAEVRPS